MVPNINIGPDIHNQIAKGLILIDNETLPSSKKSLGITYKSS